eukprot:Phypoly_transcript_23374.p1 GENE.Phypoly_transcript_23374~~Phypoly_transcript_23374.p1  ORF type:complete len:147 (+),score=22.10 Phypoly_transcript_23374:27-467(+)
MVKYFIVVACKDHVKRGIAGGFAQACHGKKSPLMKMSPGDWLVYYSPTHTFKGKDKCQMFTAIGKIKSSNVYTFDMGNGFCPSRIDVEYLKEEQMEDAPIDDLKSKLSFIANQQSWGMYFRRGLFTVEKDDFQAIADEMGVGDMIE